MGLGAGRRKRSVPAGYVSIAAGEHGPRWRALARANAVLAVDYFRIRASHAEPLQGPRFSGGRLRGRWSAALLAHRERADILPLGDDPTMIGAEPVIAGPELPTERRRAERRQRTDVDGERER